ncbi:MAG TPA: hypothetical protein VNT27_08885 [Propionibacteriaceae bacterium]|nr:hypothetical protein [Propionibacteriaceae bacterium]
MTIGIVWIVPSSDVATWHQALAYAILGRRMPELSHQDQPDVAELARELSADDQLGASVKALRARGTWPLAVPTNLMAGLGRAQFLAALAELVQELGFHAHGTHLAIDRPATADERRLLDEVPPHHRG